jgi:hypothetical protein
MCLGYVSAGIPSDLFLQGQACVLSVPPSRSQFGAGSHRPQESYRPKKANGIPSALRNVQATECDRTKEVSTTTKGSWHADDDALWQDLKAAVTENERGTEQMIDAAKAAFSWRTVDAELAALSFDSSTDALEAVRGAEQGGPRLLVFEGRSLRVDVEVGDEVVIGQVEPAQSCRVTIVSPDGDSEDADTDDEGFFSLNLPRSGPIRLKWESEASVLMTQWLTF